MLMKIRKPTNINYDKDRKENKLVHVIVSINLNNSDSSRKRFV